MERMDTENDAAFAAATLRSPLTGGLAFRSPKATSLPLSTHHDLRSPASVRRPFVPSDVANQTATAKKSSQKATMPSSASPMPFGMMALSSPPLAAAAAVTRDTSVSIVTPGTLLKTEHGSGAKPLSRATQSISKRPLSSAKKTPASNVGKSRTVTINSTPLPVSNRVLFPVEQSAAAEDVPKAVSGPAFASPLSGAVAVLDAAEAEAAVAKQRAQHRQGNSFSIGEEEEEETAAASLSVLNTPSILSSTFSAARGVSSGAYSKRPVFATTAEKNMQAWLASLMTSSVDDGADASASRASRAILQSAAGNASLPSPSSSPSPIQQADAALFRLQLALQQAAVADELRLEEEQKEEEAEMAVDEQGQEGMVMYRLFAGDGDAEDAAQPSLVHCLRRIKPASLRKALQQSLFQHLSSLQQAAQETAISAAHSMTVVEAEAGLEKAQARAALVRCEQLEEELASAQKMVDNGAVEMESLTEALTYKEEALRETSEARLKDQEAIAELRGFLTVLASEVKRLKARLALAAMAPDDLSEEEAASVDAALRAAEEAPSSASLHPAGPSGSHTSDDVTSAAAAIVSPSFLERVKSSRKAATTSSSSLSGVQAVDVDQLTDLVANLSLQVNGLRLEAATATAEASRRKDELVAGRAAWNYERQALMRELRRERAFSEALQAKLRGTSDFSVFAQEMKALHQQVDADLAHAEAEQEEARSLRRQQQHDEGESGQHVTFATDTFSRFSSPGEEQESTDAEEAVKGTPRTPAAARAQTPFSDATTASSATSRASTTSRGVKRGSASRKSGAGGLLRTPGHGMTNRLFESPAGNAPATAKKAAGLAHSISASQLMVSVDVATGSCTTAKKQLRRENVDATTFSPEANDVAQAALAMFHRAQAASTQQAGAAHHDQQQPSAEGRGLQQTASFRLLKTLRSMLAPPPPSTVAFASVPPSLSSAPADVAVANTTEEEVEHAAPADETATVIADLQGQLSVAHIHQSATEAENRAVRLQLEMLDRHYLQSQSVASRLAGELAATQATLAAAVKEKDEAWMRLGRTLEQNAARRSTVDMGTETQDGSEQVPEAAPAASAPAFSFSPLHRARMESLSSLINSSASCSVRAMALMAQVEAALAVPTLSASGPADDETEVEGQPRGAAQRDSADAAGEDGDHAVVNKEEEEEAAEAPEPRKLSATPSSAAKSSSSEAAPTPQDASAAEGRSRSNTAVGTAAWFCLSPEGTASVLDEDERQDLGEQEIEAAEQVEEDDEEEEEPLWTMQMVSAPEAESVSQSILGEDGIPAETAQPGDSALDNTADLQHMQHESEAAASLQMAAASIVADAVAEAQSASKVAEACATTTAPADAAEDDVADMNASATTASTLGTAVMNGGAFEKLLDDASSSLSASFDFSAGPVAVAAEESAAAAAAATAPEAVSPAKQKAEQKPNSAGKSAKKPASPSTVGASSAGDSAASAAAVRAVVASPSARLRRALGKSQKQNAGGMFGLSSVFSSTGGGGGAFAPAAATLATATAVGQTADVFRSRYGSSSSVLHSAQAAAEAVQVQVPMRLVVAAAAAATQQRLENGGVGSPVAAGSHSADVSNVGSRAVSRRASTTSTATTATTASFGHREEGAAPTGVVRLQHVKVAVPVSALLSSSSAAPHSADGVLPDTGAVTTFNTGSAADASSSASASTLMSQAINANLRDMSQQEKKKAAATVSAATASAAIGASKAAKGAPAAMAVSNGPAQPATVTTPPTKTRPTKQPVAAVAAVAGGAVVGARSRYGAIAAAAVAAPKAVAKKLSSAAPSADSSNALGGGSVILRITQSSPAFPSAASRGMLSPPMPMSGRFAAAMDDADATAPAAAPISAPVVAAQPPALATSPVGADVIARGTSARGKSGVLVPSRAGYVAAVKAGAGTAGASKTAATSGSSGGLLGGFKNFFGGLVGSQAVQPASGSAAAAPAKAVGSRAHGGSRRGYAVSAPQVPPNVAARAASGPAVISSESNGGSGTPWERILDCSELREDHYGPAS